MRWKERLERRRHPKRTLAFKSTPSISDEEEDLDDDEDLSLLVKNMSKMYNKAKFENRRRR